MIVEGQEDNDDSWGWGMDDIWHHIFQAGECFLGEAATEAGLEEGWVS